MTRRDQTRDQTRRYPRTARINEVVREVLAEELSRLSDPRLSLVTVTVTGVDVTRDLRHATVYYSQLTNKGRSPTADAAEATADALASASHHLRAGLARQVRMKYLPELVFRIDPAIAEGQRIEEIITRLHTDERDRPTPAAASDEAEGDQS